MKSIVIVLFFALQSGAQVATDTAFVNLEDYSNNFVLDMKYATDDNFLHQAVYDCPSCYLRFKTVKALIIARDLAAGKNLKIKMFDCYRPLDIQKKMWTIVNNPIYVADPAKGSIHNRGGAVDITLVDECGNELEMGTDFDFFGPEAAHGAKKISRKATKNRKLLKSIMSKAGFESFDSEWWHYNLPGAKKDPVSNFTWNCD